VLLGVIRGAGELDPGASSVPAAPETSGLSSDGSVWKRRAGIGSPTSAARSDMNG